MKKSSFSTGLSGLASSLMLGCLILFQVSAQAQTTVSSYFFTTLAGAASEGSTDGAVNVARFDLPNGLALDAAGNLYVSDSKNFTVRKITPGGMVSTVVGHAGDGSGLDGMGGWWQSPGAEIKGVAVDGQGTLFLAELYTIRRVASDGTQTVFAGSAGDQVYSSLDGIGPAARFNIPGGLALGPAGNLYVTDTGSNLIRQITPSAAVTTLAGSGTRGYADGPGAVASFNFSEGIAALTVDAAGTIYVADGSNTIRKIVSGGGVTTLAGNPDVTGAVDGVGPGATFNRPGGVAVDLTGNVYVADSGNDAIRKVTPAGQVTTLAGQPPADPASGRDGTAGSADGAGSLATFNNPTSLVLDSSGNLLVADSGNNTIRKVTPAGVVTTVAGLPPSQSAGAIDAVGAAARFNQPLGVAVTPEGICYVADTANHLIRKIAVNGEVTTFAGAAGQSGEVDGPGPQARFKAPSDLALDKTGNLYVIEASSLIRKISPAGVVSTLVDVAGNPGDNLTFGGLHGIAIAPSGDVYFGEYALTADAYRTPQAVVRKMTADGVLGSDVIVSAGGHPYVGFTGLGIDAGGTLYACLPEYSQLLKVSSTGVQTVSLGGLTPQRVAVDSSGQVFFTEKGFNDCVVGRLSVSGQVDIIGGQYYQSGHQDGVGSVALFDGVGGIAVDAAGAIYVACTDNTIRKGVIGAAPVISASPQNQTVTAGTSAQFSVTAAGVPSPAYQWQLNGSAISGATSSTYGIAAAQAVDAGDYTVVVTNALGTVTSAKAVLTVNPQVVSGGGTSGASGGGGGAPSWWFAAALVIIGAARASVVIRAGKPVS